MVEQIPQGKRPEEFFAQCVYGTIVRHAIYHVVALKERSHRPRELQLLQFSRHA